MKMRGAFLRTYVIVSTVVLGGIVAATAVAVLGFGSWLVVSDPVPQHLDIVFTFAGEAERVAYSRELVERFPRSHWILSDYKDGYQRILRKEGFDMTRLNAIDTCTNTYAEVDALENRILAGGPASLQDDRKETVIGLVSSPYHMRRIKFMVNRQFNNPELRFHYLPVPFERYHWDSRTFRQWWKTPAVRNIVISEFQKIVFFWLMS
jgi:hypothetical protein